MKSAFPGQFSNNTEAIKKLWSEAVIALDANVLLDLYRYSDSTRAAFLNVLELLKDRVWISYQVASEYFSNRLTVISGQVKLYDEAVKDLERLKAGFENQKQHPFVVAETLEGFIDSFNRVVGELKESQRAHARRINDDEIKEMLGVLFDGRVGPSYAQEKLEELILSGAERYKNKIPPGFKDSGKPVGELLRERCAPYGDYIGWQQLMDYSTQKGRGVIFVTGDGKEDWWLKHSGRTIGPLPDLVEEFISTTSNSFYMCQPDRFLEYANEFLRQEASPDAVEEIREVAVSDFHEEGSQRSYEWDRAVRMNGLMGLDLLSKARVTRRDIETYDETEVRRSNEQLFESDGLSKFRSERDADFEGRLYMEKVERLRARRDVLRARQLKYLSILESLNRNASDLEFEDRAPLLHERLNSATDQLESLNDELRVCQIALDAITHDSRDSK